MADPETAAASALVEPEATPAAAPEEGFTLADAEGGFVEVTGAAALEAAFERLFLDPHLSPDQIIGLWESNEAARAAIERRCGPAALAPAKERLEAAQEARARQRDDRAPANSDGGALLIPSVPEPASGRVRRRWAVQRPKALRRDATTRRLRKPVAKEGDPAPAAPAANLPAPPAETAAGNRSASKATPPGAENRGAEPGSPPTEPHRPGLDGGDAPRAPVPGLALGIDPSWGDQRVFRHYRARLAAFQGNGAGEPSDIAGFRVANSALEARLRRKLPGLMQQIDARYGDPPAPTPGTPAT